MSKDPLLGCVACATKEECSILQTFLHMKGCTWANGESLVSSYYYNHDFNYFKYFIDYDHTVTWSRESTQDDSVSFNEYMVRNKIVLGAMAKLKGKVPFALEFYLDE